MNKAEIDEHIDAKLLLAIIDNASEGNPKPMTSREIASLTGLSYREIEHIELGALKKLKKHPAAWEAITMRMRNTTVE